MSPHEPQRASPKRPESRATAQFMRTRVSVLTARFASVCIEGVKWPALFLLVCVFAAGNSCTTLVNRRDLYSPEPGPDSLEAARQWYGVTTTSTTTTRTSRSDVEALAPPEFRY